MASYRLKGRHGYDDALLQPARVAVAVDGGKEEIVFTGNDAIDFGRKKVPDEVKKHPWIEEVAEEKKTAAKKAAS